MESLNLLEPIAKRLSASIGCKACGTVFVDFNEAIPQMFKLRLNGVFSN